MDGRAREGAINLRYDIFVEILDMTGMLRIGYLRKTLLLVMMENQVAHDTIPFIVERFRDVKNSSVRF
jgi:hypothetical protein